MHYWFDSKSETYFGTSSNRFKNYRGDGHIIYRPATVEGLPGITRIRPVVFAPVNFLGAADALLFFQVMGESEYAKYWAGFPRISKVLPEFDESKMLEGEENASVRHLGAWAVNLKSFLPTRVKQLVDERSIFSWLMSSNVFVTVRDKEILRVADHSG